MKRLRDFYRRIFGYDPRELGIHNMPEIKRIYIGNCGGWGRHDYNGLNDLYALAHTHGCPDDFQEGIICIREYSYLFVYDGEILYHEYAHLLDPTRKNYGCLAKLAILKYSGITDRDFQNLFHGSEWIRIMNNLGFVARSAIPAPTFEERLEALVNAF